MSRASVIRRPLAAFACILQLLIGGAIGLADAWLVDASAGIASVHVEEPGSQTCPPVHTDDCAVCRQLTAPCAPPATAQAGSLTLGRPSRIDGASRRHASARLTRTLLPRAPPLA